MLDKESSIRLSILRFPLIIGVVFIHNYELTVRFSNGSLGNNGIGWLTDLFRNLISQGVARTAVPLFFLMSGYFFFLGVEWTKENYWSKIKSRIRTLLIPFIIWNFFTLLVYAIVQSIPVTRHYVSGSNAEISSFGIYGFLSAILGIGRMPIAYQFWFIRDLIVLGVLSPIFHFFISRIPVVSLVFFGVSWFFSAWPIGVPSSEAVFFFAIGTAAAVQEESLFRFDIFSQRLYLIYFFALSLDMFLIGTLWGGYVHRFGVFFGVLSMLCITKTIGSSAKVSQILLALSSASFFVFAAHEPLLTVFKKLAFQMIHPNAATTLLVLYLLIPAILVSLLVGAYTCCSHWFPRFTNVISGGR